PGAERELQSFPTRRSSDLVAVTTTPLWPTGLPLASWSWSTGCWAKATPFCAVLDGAVVSASFVAAPGVPSAVNVTGLPASPLDVAVSVLVPAVVLREIGRASCRERG